MVFHILYACSARMHGCMKHFSSSTFLSLHHAMHPEPSRLSMAMHGHILLISTPFFKPTPLPLSLYYIFSRRKTALGSLPFPQTKQRGRGLVRRRPGSRPFRRARRRLVLYRCSRLRGEGWEPCSVSFREGSKRSGSGKFEVGMGLRAWTAACVRKFFLKNEKNLNIWAWISRHCTGPAEGSASVECLNIEVHKAMEENVEGKDYLIC